MQKGLSPKCVAFSLDYRRKDFCTPGGVEHTCRALEKIQQSVFQRLFKGSRLSGIWEGVGVMATDRRSWSKAEPT